MPKRVPANSVSSRRIADFEWLTGPAAVRWLDWAAVAKVSLAAQVDHLRANCTSEQAHLVLEQVMLRRRGREKFDDAGRMFFTPLGLEQATDEIVAAHKAARFLGRNKIFDLCSGVGGDLLALSAVCETVGIDRDPIMAIIARANGQWLAKAGGVGSGHRGPKVVTQEVETLDPADCAAWHIDPDRRPRGRRTTRIDLHEPAAETIERLLTQNPNAAIKLAPAAQMPTGWLERAEAEWIGRGRQCRQLVAWFGDLARRPGTRSASILSSSPGACRTVVGIADIESPLAARVGPYVFEPEAAVLAAKLGGALAMEHNLAAFSPGVAYWTGDRPIFDAALSSFEVQDVLPLRLQVLRAYLRERSIGRLEIKKRGVEQDPARLRGQLNLSGSESATLLLARFDKRVVAIMARRIG